MNEILEKLMPKLIITLLILGSTEVFGMTIYDAYKIESINKEYGEKPVIISNELKPIGEKKSISKLKSIAKITECKSVWTENVLKIIENNYIPKDAYEASRWHINKINKLKPISCSTIDFGKIAVAVIYFDLDAENLNKHIKGNKLLWVSTYDKNSMKLKDIIYTGISNESIYDIRRKVRVEAIADTNNDGYHEIILDESLYAGNSYIILLFDQNGSFKKINVEGASWD